MRLFLRLCHKEQPSRGSPSRTPSKRKATPTPKQHDTNRRDFQVTRRPACPPGKYKYAPLKGNLDSHQFHLRFGCPSNSYFCFAANKWKLWSTRKVKLYLYYLLRLTLLPFQDRSVCCSQRDTVCTGPAELPRLHPRNYPLSTPPKKQPCLLSFSF